MFASAIAFDLDGTLVDSIHDIEVCLNHTLERAGMPRRDLDWVRGNVGQGAAHLVAQAIAPGTEERERDRILSEFVSYYEEHPVGTTRPFPGIPELLQNLRQEGLPLAVISNKPTAVSHRVLEELGLSHFFHTVLGGDSLPERKPSPLPLLAFLDQVGAPASRAVMVGDSAPDVQCAQAAGALSCFVTWGYGHLEGVERPPDVTLSAAPEIFPWLLDLKA